MKPTPSDGHGDHDRGVWRLRPANHPRPADVVPATPLDIHYEVPLDDGHENAGRRPVFVDVGDHGGARRRP
jgi:hypothetical protein